MNANIIMDETQSSDKHTWTTQLGRMTDVWMEFRDMIEKLYGPLREDWKFYSKSSDWQLKVL